MNAEAMENCQYIQKDLARLRGLVTGGLLTEVQLKQLLVEMNKMKPVIAKLEAFNRGADSV